MAQTHESSSSRSNEEPALDNDKLEKAQKVGETVTKETLEPADDILDEIDDVLETNAEEFVKSYIQKGGQ